jgi:hypothetical protein
MFSTSLNPRSGCRELDDWQVEDVGQLGCRGVNEVQVADGELRPYGGAVVLEAAFDLGERRSELR